MQGPGQLDDDSERNLVDRLHRVKSSQDEFNDTRHKRQMDWKNSMREDFHLNLNVPRETFTPRVASVHTISSKNKMPKGQKKKRKKPEPIEEEQG